MTNRRIQIIALIVAISIIVAGAALAMQPQQTVTSLTVLYDTPTALPGGITPTPIACPPTGLSKYSGEIPLYLNGEKLGGMTFTKGRIVIRIGEQMQSIDLPGGYHQVEVILTDEKGKLLGYLEFVFANCDGNFYFKPPTVSPIPQQSG